MSKFYAVGRGRTTGVFEEWDDCQESVKHYSNARYKKFSSYQEAIQYVRSFNQRSNSGVSKPVTNTQRTTVIRGPYPIYVDGACRSNGRSGYKQAGYGVFLGDGDSRNAAVPLDDVDDTDDFEPTNQRAELHALDHGLRIALGAMQRGDNEYFEIFTDSIYSKKCIEEWSHKWQSNGWKNAQGLPVANQDLIKSCLKKYNHINALYAKNGLGKIKITHVSGHSGIYGNEMADKLANQGADRM